jgi:hypothetical protein
MFYVPRLNVLRSACAFDVRRSRYGVLHKNVERRTENGTENDYYISRWQSADAPCSKDS